MVKSPPSDNDVLVFELRCDCGTTKHICNFFKKYIFCCYVDLEKSSKVTKPACNPPKISAVENIFTATPNISLVPCDSHERPKNSSYCDCQRTDSTEKSESSHSESSRSDSTISCEIPESNDEKVSEEITEAKSQDSLQEILSHRQFSEELKNYLGISCSYDSVFDVPLDVFQKYDTQSWTKLVLDMKNPDGSNGKIKMNNLKLKSSDGFRNKSITSLYSKNCSIVNLESFIECGNKVIDEDRKSDDICISSIFV